MGRAETLWVKIALAKCLGSLAVGSTVLAVILSQIPSSCFAAGPESGFIHDVNGRNVTEQKPTSVYPFFGQFSSDTTPVEILSYGVEYRVPRNYLESVLINDHDMSTSFAAVVRLPKFLGVTSNPDDKDGIFIGQKIVTPEIDPGIVRMISSDMPFSPKHDPNTIVFEAEPGASDVPWQFGLLRSTSRSSVRDDVYFRRPSEGFSGFVAICNRHNNICTSYLRISSESVMTFQYNPTQLWRWKYINKGISDLINGWIVKIGG